MTPERRAVEISRLRNTVEEWGTLQLSHLLKKLYKGYLGWDDDEYHDLMWSKLHKHVKSAEEGNVESYVHIANLAMFLANLKAMKNDT